MTTINISPGDLAGSESARLDPRYHYLRSLSRPLLDALSEPTPLGAVAKFRNGLNLPRAAYGGEDEEPIALYASVAAFPVYILQREGCVPLLGDEHGHISGTNLDPSELAVASDEVLMTRSRASAPGAAWSGDQAPADLPIVPAGFLIRATLQPGIEPAFVTAVLNHPAWRLLTAALAAGKSQDNLTQEVLKSVPLPRVSGDARRSIVSRYGEAMEEVTRLFEDEQDFAGVCDRVLLETFGEQPPPLPDGRVLTARVSEADVAATRTLRLDNRWHGPASVAVREAVLRRDPMRLGELFDGLPAKGRQPASVPEEEVTDDTPGAIATVSIQSGTIVRDQVKPTTPASTSRFPVKYGELLVAMDGDGSLGKAAVYTEQKPATVDSHVARCRLRGGDGIAETVACYLNSTWGRVQTTGMMTGATGQTQLSPSDLSDVLIPSTLIEDAGVIGGRYREALGEYEPVTRRARRVLCNAGADLTTILLADGALETFEGIEAFTSPDSLLGQLEQLYPSVRR